MGLSGIKGQGKTFLLKVKRKKLEEDSSIVCLPYNTMVDIVDSSLHIDNSLSRYLMDYGIWVKVWKYAICGAILTSKTFKQDYYDSSELHKGTIKILNTNNSRGEPSVILSRLFDLNISSLKKILEDTGKLFEQVRNIRQSVCVFLDKLDQGFSEYAKNFNSDSSLPNRSRNASFWQYAQYALAESSYDICMNTGRHIKVYFSIRQEALIDSQTLNKDKARNINSYIANLKYTKNDLRQMYRLYIYNEEDCNLYKHESKEERPSEAFIGIEEIPHGYVEGKNENIFDYIYRHTFKRPYDIMKICRELYFKGTDSMVLDVEDIRDTVNDEANSILKVYLEELSIFLPCTVEELGQLIRKIPGNVMDSGVMQSICSTYHLERLSMNEWNCNNNCIKCSNLQPFSTLYNIGLIGYNRKNVVNLSESIAFENLGNSIINMNAYLLPESSFYYVHPALSNRAIELRAENTLPFYVNKVQIIGDGYELEEAEKAKFEFGIEELKEQLKRERVFVSSTINDLTEERDLVRNVLKRKGLNPIMSEHKDFDMKEVQGVNSHDLCLQEVIKGYGFIFLIGDNYGGIYKGSSYQMEKTEIIKCSNGKIKEPSISLMEYYVARKNGLKHYAFMSKGIEEKYNNRTLLPEIKAEIDFIKHYSDSEGKIIGNWIGIYGNNYDLEERINASNFC